MLFGTRKKRPSTPIARPVVTPADNARGLNTLSNGPETPIMDVTAMKRALSHAAWRDPSVERRKNDEIRTAIRILERTAACVDLAQERLNEAAETLLQGQSSRSQVMRGLLTARFEELLDSLERIVTLSQDGHVNLLGGTSHTPFGTAPRNRAVQHQNELRLEIGTAGFFYVLTPIDIRRGQGGLNIPVLENGFDDDGENYEVETALLKAQQQLSRFGARLSHDAVMLVNIAKAKETLPEIAADTTVNAGSLHANDHGDLQTKSEDVA